MNIEWPRELDDELGTGVHRVLHDVVASGGAVGYANPPERAVSDKWLASLLEDVRAGDAAFALATVDGRIEALGCWRRLPWENMRHPGEVQKVMAHPDARGLGLGRAVVAALLDNARGTDLETLVLGVRGNNHGALEMYEDFGFTVSGREPTSSRWATCASTASRCTWCSATAPRSNCAVRCRAAPAGHRAGVAEAARSGSAGASGDRRRRTSVSTAQISTPTTGNAAPSQHTAAQPPAE
jgi:ribosomal protein S18 acetylase RimI-like enzyme